MILTYRAHLSLVDFINLVVQHRRETLFENTRGNRVYSDQAFDVQSVTESESLSKVSGYGSENDFSRLQTVFRTYFGFRQHVLIGSETTAPHRLSGRLS